MLCRRGFVIKLFEILLLDLSSYSPSKVSSLFHSNSGSQRFVRVPMLTRLILSVRRTKIIAPIFIIEKAGLVYYQNRATLHWLGWIQFAQNATARIHVLLQIFGYRNMVKTAWVTCLVSKSYYSKLISHIKEQ